MKKLHCWKAGRRAAAAGVTALFAVAAHAQDQTAAATPVAAATPKATPFFDRIWGYTEWYRNDDHPVIQSFRFTGRFQLDYAMVDQEDFDDLTIRRFRVGGKAAMFQHFTLHAEVDLQPENDPVYQRLTDAYISWSRSEAFEITLGKHSAPFTLDGTTSSKELLAVDRANLANNLWFPQEYFPGISVAGQPGSWHYLLGLYSSGSATPEFGRFDGGAFVLGTIGYDFAEQLKVKKAALTVNYVHNEEDANNTFTRSLSDVGSLNFNFDAGSWGFRADLSGGLGYQGQSDLWGVMLMPYYDLSSKLQAVARYTRLESRGDNGVRFGRYEDQVVSGRGDDYNEFYLGLNYYFYKHRLKLQTGVQYADMNDQAGDGGAYSGWAWTTGLRISW